MELREALVWVIGGGGSAIVAYWLMEREIFLKYSAELRRYAALALSALLAWAAYGASIGMNYLDAPTDWRGWLERLFAIGFVAVIGSQGAHGRLKLRE